MLRVCLESFCGVLCVSKRRMQCSVAHLKHTGASRPERQGGRRKFPTVAVIREAVGLHIESFKYVSSHYGRKETPDRKYLPASLPIRPMWKMFLESHADDEILTECTYDQYRHVFNTKYNLARDAGSDTNSSQES